ncbi:MAG TPA: CsbD family protein [Solirubrobacteraceae bacterium]|jgi:uncharacterized protein YjbJ (UPF0337 family)|nr:CsbD family protein [Solirubrobacteraceae bacterium]
MADGQLDRTLGRIKETIGSLTGNKSLETAGKRDQLIGKAKEFAGVVVGWGTEVAKEIKKSRTKV